MSEQRQGAALSEAAEARLWAAALEHLRPVVGEANLRRWIAPLTCKWSGGEIVLSAPDRSTRECIARHFLGHIKGALATVAGQPPRVRLELSVPTTGPSPQQPRGAWCRPLDTRLRLESFVVGQSNARAVEAAEAAAEGRSSARTLFIHGPTGVGKTHLATGVAHRVRERGAQAAYLPAREFASMLVAAYASDTEAEFWEDARRVETLILDDIHSLATQREVQKALLRALPLLFEREGPLVFTSDQPPAAIPELHEELKRGFEQGAVIGIERPEPALRLAIVRRKAAERGLALPPEVAQHIAERAIGSVRRIEGALTRLMALAELQGAPIDLSLARAALAGLPPPPPPPTLERILDVVAEAFRVPARQIVAGKQRRSTVVLARQVAMYLARRLLRCSLLEIAQDFGAHHHSTVLRACRATESRRAADPCLAALLDAAETRLVGESPAR